MDTDLVSLNDIKTAREYIFSSSEDSIKISRTPLHRQVESLSLAALKTKAHLSLKVESLQLTGSFKARGVLNVTNTLPPSSKLVTISAGNFGRSLAYVTQKKGLDTIIIMPETVPIDRISTISGFGARVEIRPAIDLPKSLMQIAQEEKATIIHPFDNKSIISAYGSIGLEILEDLPEVDVVVVPVGGGGLISGIATAIKALKSGVRVIGVEPVGANSMYLSLKEGHAITLDKVETIATGLGPPYAGKICYEHVKRFVEQIVLVNDDEIKQAVKVLYNDYKLVVEPSGAAGLAALMCNKISDVAGKNVVVVISGGNVSINDLNKILTD
eukprot:TRINITY_DN571_c0_g1_i1.p1 TRINITY_DN571_c0_g1~~TRINITY_DN571_c0_g1_i1.p1  ORF type:complete len:328 (-),score=55.52 TRINITY_DN571_c0_g1_i1:6-989(-)